MKQKAQVAIIPAHPGYQLVAVDWEKKEVFLSVAILAWRVETVESERGDSPWTEYKSAVYPICASGDACTNESGTLHPDGTVSHGSCHYDNLEDMRKQLFPPEDLKVDNGA